MKFVGLHSPITAADNGNARSSAKGLSVKDFSLETGDNPTSNFISNADGGLLEVMRLALRNGVVVGLWRRDDMFNEEKSLNNVELIDGRPAIWSLQTCKNDKYTMHDYFWLVFLFQKYLQ